MPTQAQRAIATRSEAAVLTKAVLRAADHLGMTNRLLAAVVGVSQSTVSRMRSGEFELARGQKPFELGILFVRLYRSLDAILGGDSKVAAAWLRNDNVALNAAPLAMIQTVSGLVHVIQYLDARRAIV